MVMKTSFENHSLWRAGWDLFLDQRDSRKSRKWETLGKLTIAVDIWRLCCVQSCAFVCVQGRIWIKTFWHLVTNNVYKAFKHSLKSKVELVKRLLAEMLSICSVMSSAYKKTQQLLSFLIDSVLLSLQKDSADTQLLYELSNCSAYWEKPSVTEPLNIGHLTLTLMLSLAEVSKNSRPKESAKCLPRSKEITRSSSMSHLLPTKMTCALSQEYVLICVHLKKTDKGQNNDSAS